MGSEQDDSDLEQYKNIQELIEELMAVDLNRSLAKLNETTMSDNNGGRIEL